MRLLVLSSIFLCYAKASSLDESKKLLQNELKILQKCMKDGNVSESVIDEMFKTNIIPETRTVKCLLGCHMRGMGYLSDDGKLDWKKLDEINKVQYVDPIQAKKAIEVDEACSTIVPQTLGNICDAGYAATKCFFQQAKERNLPVLGPHSI